MEKLNLNIRLGAKLGRVFQERIRATGEAKADVVRSALVQYFSLNPGGKRA